MTDLLGTLICQQAPVLFISHQSRGREAYNLDKYDNLMMVFVFILM